MSNYFFKDDGRTKPPPRATSPVQTGKTGKSGKAAPAKPRSDSSSSDHHEFSCLIRVTCKNEKISSVVSRVLVLLILSGLSELFAL